MDMSFSFEYGMYEVLGNCSWRYHLGNSSNQMPRTGWFSPSKWSSTIWTLKWFQFCWYIMPTYYLVIWKCVIWLSLNWRCWLWIFKIWGLFQHANEANAVAKQIIHLSDSFFLQLTRILYCATLQHTILQPISSSATRLNLFWSNCDGCNMAKTRRDCNNSRPPP